jgi:rhodanese-related sulfurtransferase
MNTFLVIVGVIVVFIAISRFISAGSNRGITMVDAAAAKKLAEDPQVVIIDVRTPGEFSGGHLKNAKLIPVTEIGSRIDEIANLKDSTILVYCRSGHRSSMAAQVLGKQGFTKVNNLKGGISAWESAGYGVTKK